MYNIMISTQKSIRTRALSVALGLILTVPALAANYDNNQAAAEVSLYGKGTVPGDTPVTIKPASTAAVATDPAAVVTISPNTALPAGANTIGNVGLVAGAAAIGTVGVTSLPVVPAGTVATADAVAGTGVQEVSSGLWNGTNLDRARGNVDTGALVTLTAAAAGGNTADQSNVNGRGLKLVIDITALTGTSPTLTVTIQGKDTASGKYYTILASTALAAVATTVLEVYPGIATAANATQGVALPRTWRVLYAIGGTTPAVTATVGASVIL